MHSISMLKLNQWIGGRVVRPLYVAASALLLVAGCGRNDTQVYRLAKDSSPPQPAPDGQPAMAAGQDSAAPPGPGLTWTLPSGWEQKPASEMRVASFAIAGKDGQSADVSIIPLPSGSPEHDLVNMWRQQMHLAPVNSGDAPKSEAVTVGTDTGKLFDISSEEPILDGKSRARILVAEVNRGPMSWFFKMTGESEFVASQKTVFAQFLKSVAFQPGGSEAPMQFSDSHHFLSTNAKQAPSENSEKPIWVVPPDWNEVPATQFLLAKFEVAGTDGKAEVSVSMLAGTGGGLLPNVNRWRRQLGLDPIDDDGLAKSSSSLDVAGGKGTLVDMSGTDARSGRSTRVVGVVVPQADQTWFYKLMGDGGAVEKEKEIFTRFVRTVQYPNAS